MPAPAGGTRPWPFQEPAAVSPSGMVVGEIQTGFSEPVIAHWMYIAVWDRRGRLIRTVPHPAQRSGLRPRAVNAHGLIVGMLSGTAVAEQDFPHEAVLWAPDGRGLRTLGEGRASDINDRGEVVGSTEEGRAVLWTPSGAVDLGQGYAAAINNRGQVVGITTVTVSGWPEASTGFLFEHGRRTELTAPGCRTAGAVDINDRGQIVGWGRKDPEEFDSNRAILWQGGRGYDLNRLVRGMRAGWRLRAAGAVNERGQILCAAAYRDDTQRACLLTPAGEGGD